MHTAHKHCTYLIYKTKMELDTMSTSPQETPWQLFESFEETQKETPQKHEITLHGGHVIPAKKNQDWVKTLVTEEDNPAIVVLDGHGKGKVVTSLKAAPWERILTLPDPIQETRSYISKHVANTRSDGSTFASVELLKNGFRCRWLGDSEIIIYHNSELYWRSTSHSSSNMDELIRLKNLGVKVRSAMGLHAIDEQIITMASNPYCVWANAEYGPDGKILPENKTAMTRGFGHVGLITTFDGEMQIIKFNKPGNWRAVVYTDGVGDVACDKTVRSFGTSNMPPAHIAEIAHKKWNQGWNYLHPTSCRCIECISNKTQTLDPMPTKIPDSDDIGVAVLEVNVEL